MKNIKNFVLNKKVVAILLLLITIVSNISPVFAVSGSGKFVGGQFASGMMTTDHTQQSTGVLLRKLINRTTGEQYTVFCAEHKIDFTTDVIYNGSYYTPTDANVKRACKIAYFRMVFKIWKLCYRWWSISRINETKKRRLCVYPAIYLGNARTIKCYI